MPLLIMTGLIIAGFINKNSKTLYFLQLTWIWVILSFCGYYYRPDFENYQLYYYASGASELNIANRDWGFYLLNKALYSLGLNFDQALAAFFFLILLLIALSIPYYTEYICVPLSLFMLYPMFIHGIQIRNAFAMSIALFAFRYVLGHKPLKYLGFIAVATLFHSTAVFYLSFILIIWLGKKQLWAVVLVAMTVLAISREVLWFVFRDLAEERWLLEKLQNTNSLSEMVMASLWQITGFIIIVMAVLALRKNHKKKLRPEGLPVDISNKFMEYFERINILMLILAPLYLIDFSFERLFRNTFVLLYCFFINWVYEKKYSSRGNIYFIKIAMGLWFGFTVSYFSFIYNEFDLYIEQYLFQNQLLNNPLSYAPLIMILAVIGLFILIMEIGHFKFKFNKKIKFVLNR